MLRPRSISPTRTGSRRSPSSPPALLLKRLGLGPGPTTTAPTTPSPNQDHNGPPGLLDDDVAEQLAAYSKAVGELASSHPVAYAAFVRAQDEAAAHSEISAGRVIMPEPGFVVRASITAAVPRISEAGAGRPKSRRRSQPLLVNIVSHHAVQWPVVPSALLSSGGTAVLVEEEQGWTADLGIQVSLLVGAPRSTSASDITAADVLVNPWVVREALKHRAFQAQVVTLALEWVAAETGLDVRVDEPCVVLPAAVCSYWDTGEQQQGGGDGMRKPRPFVLDEAVARQQLAPEERPEQTLQDPKSLLAAIMRGSSSETPPATATATATAPLLKPRPPPARRVPISIDDEDSDDNEQPSLGLKRGFLLD